MANFLSVKHGIANWVEDQILHDITDVPLKKKGKIQSKETAQLFLECSAKRVYELD